MTLPDGWMEIVSSGSPNWSGITWEKVSDPNTWVEYEANEIEVAGSIPLSVFRAFLERVEEWLKAREEDD